MEKRTIKFRGIRIDNGERVYRYYSYNPVLKEHKISTHKNNYNMYGDKKSKQRLLVQCTYVVEPESVGQYTGLKDKNGVEIYEGDIVKVKAYNKFFNVEVEYLNHGYLPFIYIDEKCGIGNIDNKECFVIGNIHQNKELLEE